MAWLRKSRAEVADVPTPTRESADLEAQPWVEQLVRPCARIELGPPGDSPVASRIGGVPYLPVGLPWPAVDGRAAIFVCQVDFAEVPTLPAFPADGVLQWFVGPDETFGIDDDADGDFAAAPTCRWFPGPFTSDLQSRGVNEGADLPFAIAAGAGMTFTAARSLPSWDELSTDQQQLPVWRSVAAAYGDAKARGLMGYEQFVRGGKTDHDFDISDASSVGGYVTEAPDADTEDRRLIMQIDFGHLSDYVDLDADCAGELWGDPAALAAGDLSQLAQRWY